MLLISRKAGALPRCQVPMRRLSLFCSRPLRRRRIAALPRALAALLTLAAPALQPAADVDFARQIQPIFAESCYGCHGPQVQMAGLRLDRPPGAKTALILQRITSTEARTRMPLGGAPLAPEKIALIRQWLDSGANWPQT